MIPHGWRADWPKCIATAQTQLCCYRADLRILLLRRPKYIATAQTQVYCCCADPSVLLLRRPKYIATAQTQVYCSCADPSILLLRRPKYIATAQTSLSCVKIHLSLSHVHYFHNLFNKIDLQEFKAYYTTVCVSLKIKIFFYVFCC